MSLIITPSTLLLLMRGATARLPPPSFTEELLAYLKNATSVTVYPGHIPENARLPAVYFSMISSDHLTKITGGAGTASDLYQIAAVSTTYGDVERLSEKVRLSLHGFRGWMGQTFVQSALPGPHVHLYRAAVDGSDRGYHSLVREWMFHRNELIPSFAY